MEREKLLDKIIKYRISYKDKSFLDREEWLLELLLTLDYDLLEYGINILDLYKNDNLAYEAIVLLKEYHNKEIGKCLTNMDTIASGISFEGARLLGESKNNFNLANACEVICNKTSIEGNIALEGAKIINNSSKWFNAYYARYPLTSTVAIKNGIALEGAKIINTLDEEYKALISSTILCNEYTNFNGIAVEIINKIKTAGNWDTINKMLEGYFEGNIDYFEKDHLYDDDTYSLILNKAIRTKCYKK